MLVTLGVKGSGDEPSSVKQSAVFYINVLLYVKFTY